MSEPRKEMNTAYGGDSSITSVSGEITVAMVAVMFALFIIILVLYIKSKVYEGATGSLRSRSRLRFSAQEPTLPRRALDPSILNSLPVTVFESKNLEEDDGCIECAVCICELTNGEKVRRLPNCKHCFHVECIDMWFHSNNTCPLCRNLVTTTETSSMEITIDPLEAVTEPGSSSNSSSSSSSRKRLVIDIPRHTMNGFSSSNTPLASSKIPSNSPLPTSRLLLAEIKSPKSPALGKTKSLKIMMSRVSFKGVGTSYTPVGYDIEQGDVAGSKCE